MFEELIFHTDMADEVIRCEQTVIAGVHNQRSITAHDHVNMDDIATSR